jgi:predicted GH43/DUF377 family glycosyl hydrolase
MSRRELVAVSYRGRPRLDPGYLMARSHIGLALFDAALQLLHRFPDPLLSPDAHASAPDYLGVEDPRITRIDDRLAGTWRSTIRGTSRRTARGCTRSAQRC